MLTDAARQGGEQRKARENGGRKKKEENEQTEKYNENGGERRRMLHDPWAYDLDRNKSRLRPDFKARDYKN